MSTPSFHPFRSEQAQAEFHAFYAEKAKAWPLPPQTRFVDTASARTFVRVGGRETDPPLVLLPGARGSSLMWVPSIVGLSARCRTYALDLVDDIGLSVPRRQFKKPDDLVFWLDEVLTALVPDRPVNLAGMSYGGWLASLYALRFPSRVNKAVLLAPGGAVHRLSWSFVLRVLTLSVPLPFQKSTALERTMRWIFEDSYRAGATLQAMVRQMLEMVMIGKTLAQPRMMWTTVLSDEEWRRFRAPALFLVGENEKIYSAQSAVARLNRLAPGIKTEIIPGAGHDLMMVQANLVVERMLAFLAEPASTVPVTADAEAVGAA